jgi:asparagine synthase (glutamine-hydrolysing)
MSGIFGVLDSKRNPYLSPLLSRIGQQMSHREWYVVETYADEEAGVGLGRIGIGIFNQERQPIFSEDGSLMLCLSGEFYRTAELRRDLQAKGCFFRDESDLELALRLYQVKGEQFIHELEGVFVLAVWDGRQQELLIANDRAGLYPLLYAHYNGKLIFAPEMKGILCDPDFHKKLDLTALADYMRFQHLLGDKTFFEELKLLPNASFLRYNLKSDCLTIRPYWDFSRIPHLPPTLAFEEAIEETSRLLKAAVDNSTAGSYRLGLYLSAGVDSRAILGFMHRGLFPVNTITFGQKDCRDVVYAQQIAAKVGAKHHYFGFFDGKWVQEFANFHLELTEGFHSWIHSHGISIMHQVRPLLDLNLTGFGGGQSAIDWEDPALLQAKDDIAFTSRLFDLLSQGTTWPSLNDSEEKFLFSPKIAATMRDLAFQSFCSEVAKYDYLPYAERAAYFALCNPDRRLFQYYVVFHRSHFEQRFPFYDYRYFEFVYALPPEMLFKRRLRRAIILKEMRSLAQVPYDKDDLPITGNKLAGTAAKLVKKSQLLVNYIAPIFPEYATLYADYENWLRHELCEWGENILLGQQTLQRNIFNPAFLRSLWGRHQSGLEIHTIGKLAPIMTYEMMLRRFYD